ncbi:PHP domain-containing protein [Aeromicrobium sp. CFBP 8757]|uniref:PHP domain-containing protein n=1 Tax=Aeromicrobium sp. CFBP 8757 TaxID=2775288 RepID=UPI0017833C53|nr:PHP domain-containing protein [Aeromicrobium sp. CFBP 8757]MBD8605749.1 PHP domain-containing protein [Aeromicrobium sp. CFBP 8757]
MPDLTAVDALKEVAFWLERSRASTYRAEAFRNAAAAIDDLSPEQVATRTRNGQLKRVKGIGDRTFGVIRQVVEGDVPDYLAELRDEGAEPLASGGAALRAELRGDLHSHSEWSDGGSPIAEMARVARWRGREYQVLTDHSPRLKIANGLSAERLAQQLDVVAEVDATYDDFQLLSGIEVDILDDGGLDQTDEMLERLDVVVASVHSKLRMERRAMTRRMMTAVADPHTNVLGHCTGRLVQGGRGKRPESEFNAKAVFAACAEFDVAVEINARPERQDPPDPLIELALDAGCLFSIDTDAHAPGQLDFLDLGAERADAMGVPADRIVTTWPVERLLEWSHAKR